MPSKTNYTTGPSVLITGGSGFLGTALVRELISDDHRYSIRPSKIIIYDLSEPRHRADNVRFVKGDVRSYESLAEASKGVDVIFHCAAVVDWGQHPESHVYEVNVTGTENVIKAARKSGTRALVYTSTMDVFYSGRPIRNGDETLPYPENYTMPYAKSKALAEMAVIKANGSRSLADTDEEVALSTCVIRPCGMFGEGDPYHVGHLLRMVRQGRLPFRIGSGRALFQHVYVGNVAHALVLAAQAILKPGSSVSGKGYLITDFNAKNFFDYLEPIITGIGYRMPPKTRSIPTPIIYSLATLAEAVAWVCRPFFKFSPTLNRKSVAMVCHDMTFNGERACIELQYAPKYSEEEAYANTIAYFKNQSDC